MHLYDLRYGMIYDHLLSIIIYKPVNMVNKVNKDKIWVNMDKNG